MRGGGGRGGILLFLFMNGFAVKSHEHVVILILVQVQTIGCQSESTWWCIEGLTAGEGIPLEQPTEGS